MIKSLLAANKSEKDRFVIPRSVQQSIPIRCVYSDGIWHTGRKHSRIVIMRYAEKPVPGVMEKVKDTLISQNFLDKKRSIYCKND